MKRIIKIITGLLIIVWAFMFQLTGIMLFSSFLRLMEQIRISLPEITSRSIWFMHLIVSIIPSFVFFSIIGISVLIYSYGASYIKVRSFETIKGKIEIKRDKLAGR